MLVYDCHSIRSRIPRLFDGELPEFNLGTNSGSSADPSLVKLVGERLAGQSFVIDGRFKGGWITRAFGNPSKGVHALQMELACRAYIEEPIGPVDEADWPVAYDEGYARTTRDALKDILTTCARLDASGGEAMRRETSRRHHVPHAEAPRGGLEAYFTARRGRRHEGVRKLASPRLRPAPPRGPGWRALQGRFAAPQDEGGGCDADIQPVLAYSED